MLQWLLNGMSRVSAFTVHEPPDAGRTRLERAERLYFVADGFSWRAALLGPFFLLARGAWLALAIYVATALVLMGGLKLVGAGNEWVTLMIVLLNIVTGFEASEVKRRALARAGWREIAAVNGRGQEDAERRFFEAWLPTVPDGPAAESAPSPDHGAAARIEAAVGRLSERLRSGFFIKT